MKFSTTIWIIVAIIAFSNSSRSQVDENANDSSTISIELRRNVSVNRPEVRIRDVAIVEGGEFFERRKIANLDLLDMINVESTSVRRSLIAVRIRLAGFNSDQMEFKGALQTRIELRQASVDDLVLDSLKQPVADLWDAETNDVEFRLLRPLPNQTVSQLNSVEELSLRPFVDEKTRPGQNRIKFGAYENDRLKFVFFANVQASVYKNVAVAQRDLFARQQLSADDFSYARRRISQGAVSLDNTITTGHLLKKRIRKGETIVAADLQVPTPNAKDDEAEIVVKRREIVRLVAQKKGLWVSVPDGEALQDGKLGQRIRVRNLKTRKVLIGRVVGGGVVEMSF